MHSRPPRSSKSSIASPSTAGKRTANAYSVSKPWRIILRSPQQTHRLGQCLGTLLQGGEVLALCGELGTGKTSLVRGVAEGLLAAPTEVSSPTFTLIHEYRGRLRLIHADLYRLTASQLEDTGLSDYLDGHAVTAIEWADRWGSGLPSDRLDIHLSHRPPRTRRAVLTAGGPSAGRLLHSLRNLFSKRRPTREPRQTGVQLPRSRRTSL
jgi:tRNA threonylcarbamoyladenosine biosynthesis protein TsaE